MVSFQSRVLRYANIYTCQRSTRWHDIKSHFKWVRNHVIIILNCKWKEGVTIIYTSNNYEWWGGTKVNIVTYGKREWLGSIEECHSISIKTTDSCMKMRVQGFVIFNTQWAVAERFSWTIICGFGRQNILATTKMLQFTKVCLVRKIAEVLVVYSMHSKWIPKDTQPGERSFILNFSPFTTEFVAFQEWLKLKIPPYVHTVHCAIFAVFD